MLKEAIDRMLAAGADITAPRVANYDPAKPTVFRDAGGNVHFRMPEPLLRNHDAYDFVTIARLAAKFKGKSSIWRGRDTVVVFTDDSTRLERATISLTSSEAFTKATELAEKKPSFSQKELYYLLRTTLRCNESIDLAKRIASIKFDITQAGNAEISRGKSSIGKQISARMEGLQDVPEETFLTLPLFDDPALQAFAPVMFFVDPDETNQTIKFFPLPGQIEEALQAADKAIEGSIYRALDAVQEDEGIQGPLSDIVPVYFGVP